MKKKKGKRKKLKVFKRLLSVSQTWWEWPLQFQTSYLALALCGVSYCLFVLPLSPAPVERAQLTSIKGGAGRRLGIAHFERQFKLRNNSAKFVREGRWGKGQRLSCFLSFINTVSVTLVAKPIFNSARVRDVKSSIFPGKKVSYDDSYYRHSCVKIRMRCCCSLLLFMLQNCKGNPQCLFGANAFLRL